MLSFVVFLILSCQHSLWGNEESLKAIAQKAQKKAETYKEIILQKQVQVRTALEAKNCQAFAPCQAKNTDTLEGERSQSENLGKDSPLLEDKAPIIFVSSSMPLQSLKTLALQAKKYRAKLVIRGMVKGSLRETAALTRLINYPLDIDPKLFPAYSIFKVPVFLIFSNTHWHKVQGNVDLLYALEKTQEEKSPEPRRLS